MLVKVSKWLVVLALCASIGAHWQVLQSVAWASMAISYSQDSSSLTQVLSRIFDGKHPCKLCKLVAEGKKAEKKRQAQFKISKLDLLWANQSGSILTPPMADHCICAPSVALDHSAPPPTPPPRVSALT